MRRMLGGLVGRGDAAALSAPDLELVRRIEALMPQGRLATPLAGDDGRPTDRPWAPGAAGPPEAGAAAPAARRAAEAVLDELRRYAEAHRDVRCPNARSVLGGRLGLWAELMLDRGAALEEVRWWCEQLRRVEDARLFTRSNWVTASSFEDALSHCRLVLVDLRCAMEREAGGAGQRQLREALEGAHAAGRDAADRLAEFLFLALRDRPASARRCFHDLDRRRPTPDDAAEDRLLLSLLELERLRLTDLVAQDLVGDRDDGRALAAGADGQRELFEEEQADSDGAAGDEVFDDGDLALTFVRAEPPRRGADSAGAPRAEEREAVRAARGAAALLRRALQSGDGAPATRIAPDLVATIGPSALEAFFELHGLYALLAALLQRMELALQAVREYAAFVCFLPVHRAAVLDLEVLLPELRRRVASAVGRVVDAYERLERQRAPPGRGEVLERAEALLQRLERCMMAATTSALPALRACTPTSTLGGFDGWRSGDMRWLQVARVGIAARALLPSRELASLEVPDLAASLRRCCRAPLALAAPHKGGEPPEGSTEEALALRAAPPAAAPARRLASIGLARLADEDTRLHALGCSLGALGQKAAASAGPVCGLIVARAPRVSKERLDEWLRAGMGAVAMLPSVASMEKVNDAVARASKTVASFLDPAGPGFGCDLLDDNWVLVEGLPGSAAPEEERHGAAAGDAAKGGGDDGGCTDPEADLALYIVDPA